MWNLDEKKLQEMLDGFLNFQEVWTLEKVKNMTLEEYTNIKKDNPNRDDFTFWIESKLDNLGSIWGGSAFKFGIYRRNDESQKESSSGRLYSQNYAWIAKYGNNENEAFNNIKEKIIQIIQASQDNNLKTIEKIDFGDAIKWKIAFHYQDVKNIKIVNIFSKNVLDLISLNEFKEKLKIYQIHKKLLENKNLSLVKMIENIAIPLWNKYGMDSQNYIDKMKNLFSEYLNKKKLDKNTINKYIQVIENISKEFLKENLYSCDLFSFDQNINKLNKNEEFKLKNSNGHNMYSSALNYYRAFLIDYYEQDIFITERVQSEESNMKIIPLNQILYGPPGTGKTYHTIDKALEILGENLESRDEKKAKFDEYVRKGQIVFTTFHQSYGYEEFVEGIKPIIDNDENSQEVKYDVKDGIFKELCDKSLKNYILSMQNENEIDLDKLIFEFANYINQDFLNKGNEFPLENKVSIKKILLNFKDEYRSFSLGGSIKSPQSLTIDIIKRDYLNFKNKKILSFKDIKPKYDSQSDYHGNAIYYFMFYNKLKEFENIQNEKFKIKKEILKSYIIIIDEINRGNVSKIFGELITLIEPSKRIGEKEELKVTLPYSGEKFGVPKNVYIIGTMNTADRSITSLDTALRRRFEFVEMMPDVSKLSMDCEGINLQELLKAINTRIEYLLDREKTIGHAFFVSVENLEDLKKVFQNKIIPLLQEYFYNDYALINAVLNDNDMIFEDKKDDKYLQKIKNLDSVNSERSIYNIASFDDKIWDKIEIYQAIYNDEIANKLKNENE
ncbi:McrB family protein [Campylobacter jejuni]|uniref:Endonuclease n=1 Tax=Campylobacter jejuni subsp. jejuni serotype O:2 (strain ATCC 700819 / NCTC 11168) TaxID=192222 RepID=Q0PBZ8_CAMJE|nr:McrB family protein [Campylobacter jejuni]YP_002343599.1 endonuclease [Campylobacter jejuni subsp. jejuni NCTC 11168 = ATCC 700819]EAH9790241.1 McrB family protein [Campylobacter coli]WPM66856.1 McrB family protein [Campylobacter sp. CFSAN122778]AHK52769.1 endonuclease [Campylobacter jejuni subsp. jejuni NCTC 11168-K12E5]AHK54434.1 endonuclease [Campylobacter jejuni subsp. jejuni NCTC 11168-Kf1]AHK56099.1 endonuclease [Campylobacter jejuni subsp. jejuni NCTC 11168-mcK12E5]